MTAVIPTWMYKWFSSKSAEAWYSIIFTMLYSTVGSILGRFKQQNSVAFVPVMCRMLTGKLHVQLLLLHNKCERVIAKSISP
jgi:hypothetical protein